MGRKHYSALTACISLVLCGAIAGSYYLSTSPIPQQHDPVFAERHAAFTADKTRTTAIQIKAGAVFTVPLTDGSMGLARCENIDSKARLTIITGGQFLDLQLVAWGVEPPTPPTPPNPPNPPTPPASVASALIVITDNPVASGGWTTRAVKDYCSNHGVTAYNYAISSVADPTADPVGLSWIGKSAGNQTPWVFVSDAAGKTLWAGPPPSNDAAWTELLDRFAAATPSCLGGSCKGGAQ